MNVGAGIAFVMDMREHKSTLALLQQPEMGFAEHEDGAWTWICVQRELRRPVEAPSGSALHLATVFGLPVKRGKAFKREQGRLNATKRWAVAVRAPPRRTA